LKAKQQIAVLGFNVDDLAGRRKKASGSSSLKYRDLSTLEHTWSGRGKHPKWLKHKLAEGRSLEEFVVASA
jgi:DNA-binding protein H-NS